MEEPALARAAPAWCPAHPSALLCPQAGRLFDHGGTVFFSIFMSLWAVLFLEFWKRTNASLAHHWDCSEFEDIEVGSGPLRCLPKPHGPKTPGTPDALLSLSQERPRPQFTATAPMTIINPITGAEEPYFPKRSRLHRILAGSTVITMMVRLRGLEQQLPTACPGAVGRSGMGSVWDKRAWVELGMKSLACGGTYGSLLAQPAPCCTQAQLPTLDLPRNLCTGLTVEFSFPMQAPHTPRAVFADCHGGDIRGLHYPLPGSGRHPPLQLRLLLVCGFGKR